MQLTIHLEDITYVSISLLPIGKTNDVKFARKLCSLVQLLLFMSLPRTTPVLQNEIQSAHYGKNQITIHPVPCYYFNKNNQLTRELVVILSRDINHDYFAVAAFQKTLVT